VASRNILFGAVLIHLTDTTFSVFSGK